MLKPELMGIDGGSGIGALEVAIIAVVIILLVPSLIPSLRLFPAAPRPGA